MKIRSGFVSNSSSSSFVIINKTDETLPLVEFAKEVDFLVKEFNDYYNSDVLLEDVLNDAETEYNWLNLEPGVNQVQFGDKSGDSLGRVYDYMLRNGGETERFGWCFVRFLR